MHTTTSTATVYRVAYYRQGATERQGWRYKLFASEKAARNYINALQTPRSGATPERYANLAPIAEVRLSWGPVRFEEIDLGDLEYVPPGPATPRAPAEPEKPALINGYQPHVWARIQEQDRLAAEEREREAAANDEDPR